MGRTRLLVLLALVLVAALAVHGSQDGEAKKEKAKSKDAVDDVTELHEAAKRGDWEGIQALVEEGLHVDVRHKNKTALHVAVEGQKLAVQTLLKLGADPNAVVSDGGKVSALHLAAIDGNGDIVRILLEKGADPAALDEKGRQPLHRACYGGKDDAVRALVFESLNQPRSKPPCLSSLRDEERFYRFSIRGCRIRSTPG